MTSKKSTAGTGKKTAKLKLKKETIKDLNAKGSGKDVKGGYIFDAATTIRALNCSAHCVTLTYCGTQCMCNPTDYCRKG